MPKVNTIWLVDFMYNNNTYNYSLEYQHKKKMKTHIMGKF